MEGKEKKNPRWLSILHFLWGIIDSLVFKKKGLLGNSPSRFAYEDNNKNLTNSFEMKEKETFINKKSSINSLHQIFLQRCQLLVRVFLHHLHFVFVRFLKRYSIQLECLVEWPLKKGRGEKSSGKRKIRDRKIICKS